MVPRTRSALVATLVLVSVVATGCKQWGPLESIYNGSVRVRANGSAYLERSQRAVNSLRLEDPSNDGNTVYARTTFSWYYADDPCYSIDGCPVKWHSDAPRSTAEISNSIRTFKFTAPLHPLGLKVRVRAQACAQMGWPIPDSCSDEPAIATFDY